MDEEAEAIAMVKKTRRLALRLCLPEPALDPPEQGHLKAGCYGWPFL